MRTVLIRMAAVCGIVCLLVISTIGCGSTNINTQKQTGTMTAGTYSIDLSAWRVVGTASTSDIKISTDTTIANGTTMNITGVVSWSGTGTLPITGPGRAEQSTKVTIVVGQTEQPPR